MIEIWFQDEARIGQKNPITRSWARKGTRPRQPADQRYQNAYLFGAICPKMGKGAALMLPFSNTAAMQIHLNEISRHVAPKAHGVVLMDRARMAHNSCIACSIRQRTSPSSAKLPSRAIKSGIGRKVNLEVAYHIFLKAAITTSSCPGYIRSN